MPKGASLLKQRIITALILLPVVLGGLFYLEALAFSWFVAGITVIGAWEWARLAGLYGQVQRITYSLFILLIVASLTGKQAEFLLYIAMFWWLLALLLVLSFPESSKFWHAKPARLLLGLFILLPFWQGAIYLRNASLVDFPELSSLWLMFYAMFIVFAADTGAYFSGKAWGKSKLAPKVSPGKSWAGFWGGMASSCCLALLAAYFLNADLQQLFKILLITGVVAVFSVVGDLTESMFKRHEGVKDSSQLLPGHGGVLDRIDSLTAAFPLFAGLLLVTGWSSS